MKTIKVIFFILIFIISKNTYSQPVLNYFPEINGSGAVGALFLKGDTIFIGGVFSSVGGLNRLNIAAINIRTGQVLPLNSNINSTVELLLVYQNRLYFSTIGTVKSIDLINNTITNWQINLVITSSWSYPQSSALAAYKNNIYVSGVFDSINGQAKKNFAVIDATTGIINNNYPILESGIGTVNSMVVKDSILYAGFSAYNLNTGQKTFWNPNPNVQDPQSLTYSLGTNSIYVGGGFISIGNQLRNGIAELDLVNGNATPWNPGTGAKIICSAKSCVFAQSNILESYDKITAGKIDTWIPNNTVYALASYGDTLIIGGQFTKLGWVNRIGLAAVTKGLSLGVNEANNTIQNISVYPNPASSKITFSINETSIKTINVSITNMLGEVVFNKTLNYQKEIDIPVSELYSGLYFIKIQASDKTYCGKFIKE